MTLFKWGSKTYLMGVLNTTPDSFSNDGVYENVQLAISKGVQMLSNGADLLDVGGLSTRPPSIYGSVDFVSEQHEIDRVVPVIEGLASRTNGFISIDTYKSSVAEAAINAGAQMVNDIWALSADPNMASLVAEKKVFVVIMHNVVKPRYQDVVSDTAEFLKRRVDFAVTAGIQEEKILIDPGIGFGKGLEENLQILNSLEDYKKIGVPLLLGTSRKATIGDVLGLPVDDRVEGTAATVAVAITKGVDVIRVHDVKEMHRIAKMTDAIVRR